jgi:TRAP transporter TAXI family solute receptor
MKGLHALVCGLAAMGLALGGAQVPASAQTYVIATNPQGSIFYTAGASVAKLLSEKAGMQVRPQPTAGSTSNVPMLDRGEIDFVVLNIVDANAAYEATDHFEGQPPAKNVRLVTALFKVLFGLAVADDAPFRSIKDLKGARIPTEYISQRAVVPSIKAFLASGGLTFDDMKPFPVTNYVKGVEALGDGKVDVAAVGPDTTVAKELHVKLARRGGLRMLPLETTPEAWAAIHKIFPSMKAVQLKPTPTMASIRSEIPVSTSSVFLATHDKMPEETVYKVVRTLYENKDQLLALHPVFGSFEPGALAEVAATPYHGGARKLLTELGQWPPK